MYNFVHCNIPLFVHSYSIINNYLIIKSIFEEGKELYGARRLKKSILNETGWIINLKKIRRIMKKYDLRVKYHKVFRTNMNQKRIEENVKSNLLKRNFKCEHINQC